MPGRPGNIPPNQEHPMNSVIYLVGLVVVVGVIIAFVF